MMLEEYVPASLPAVARFRVSLDESLPFELGRFPRLARSRAPSRESAPMPGSTTCRSARNTHPPTPALEEPLRGGDWHLCFEHPHLQIKAWKNFVLLQIFLAVGCFASVGSPYSINSWPRMPYAPLLEATASDAQRRTYPIGHRLDKPYLRPELAGSDQVDIALCLRTLDLWAAEVKEYIDRVAYLYLRQPERYQHSWGISAFFA